MVIVMVMVMVMVMVVVMVVVMVMVMVIVMMTVKCGPGHLNITHGIAVGRHQQLGEGWRELSEGKCCEMVVFEMEFHEFRSSLQRKFSQFVVVENENLEIR